MEFTNGLILDIVLGMVIVLSIVFGAYKGFARTIIGFAQWFVCLVIAYLGASKVKALLIDYTTMDDSIKKNITDHMAGSVTESSSYNAVPDLFSGWIEDGSKTIINSAAESITSIVLSVISFLIIILAIKVICFLISRIFSRKYHDGTVGFVDGFLGFVLGAIRGVLYVYLILAFLVPLLSLIAPEFSNTVLAAMDTSYVAKYLYNDNILLLMVRDVFK